MNKVSTFSRSVSNFSKMGQYFTDTAHSEAIGRLLDWPESEVCILEPSIGDASGLFAFLDQKENRTVFGVELDSKIYKEHLKTKKVDYLLNADFINGVTISNRAFSLVFANPPYGDSEYKERYESLFMKRIFNHIKYNGLLVLVIPYYLFDKDPKFADKFTNRYVVEALYKFHPKEFSKYKQVVLIGRAKKELTEEKEESIKLQRKALLIDELEELPFDYCGKKIQILPSSSESVNIFQSAAIDLDEMARAYKSGKLLSRVNILEKVNHAKELRPPIPPKNDHLYLMGTTGFTSGPIGSEDEHDLHLQRGKVKEENIVETKTSDDGKGVIETIKTIRTTSMVLLEANGQITRL